MCMCVCVVCACVYVCGMCGMCVRACVCGVCVCGFEKRPPSTTHNYKYLEIAIIGYVSQERKQMLPRNSP